MPKTTSRLSLATGAVLLAGTALLAGCGAPEPQVTRSSSMEQTTTTTPRPVVSSTTTTTEQVQRP